MSMSTELHSYVLNSFRTLSYRHFIWDGTMLSVCVADLLEADTIQYIELRGCWDDQHVGAL